MHDSLQYSSGGSDALVIELSRGRRAAMAFAFVILLLVFVAVAVIFVVLNVRSRDALPMLLICLGMCSLAVWGVLDTGRRFVLTATHLIMRPMFGGARAIAWADVVKVQQAGSQAFVFESRHGETIAMSRAFSHPELWSRVRDALRSNAAVTLAGLPGMDAAGEHSRLAATVQSLAAIAAGLAVILAQRVDWRDADLRCVQESAVSMFGEAGRCVDYASATHDVARLEELLESGADPDRANRNGDRPLHVAVRERFPEGVRALLGAGADPMGGNRDDDTALEIAARLHDEESLHAMLRHLASGGSRDRASQALQLAIQSGDAAFRAAVQTELGALLPRIADPEIEAKYAQLMEQAAAALEARDYGSLIALAESAIELDPTTAAGHQLAGYGYAQRRNWGYAKLRLLKAVELTPDSALAWAYLGNLYYLTGEYEQADAAYGEALSLRPDMWEWYADRGASRAEQGRHQAALEDLTKACDNDVAPGCELQRELLRKLRD